MRDSIRLYGKVARWNEATSLMSCSLARLAHRRALASNSMVIAAILGYLFGSIPSAVLVGRRLGFDPRSFGDGNPGWWNMRKLAGDNRAWAVFLLDIVKGIIPVLVVSNLWGEWWWAYVAAMFAVIGHAFPVFANFRGGRSVLTFMGAMAVIAPQAVAITVGAGLLVALATRAFAYGARVMVFGVPLVQLFFHPAEHVAVTGVVMTFVGLRFLSAYIGDRAMSARERTSPA
jgi:glycerol-3-phosphate acyltransferase PlsY